MSDSRNTGQIVQAAVFIAAILCAAPALAAQSSCGQRCLEHIARYYRVSDEARQKGVEALPEKKSHSMLELQEAFAAMGIPTDGRNLSIDDVRSLQRPIVAHLDNNHFAVVETVGENEVLLLDNEYRESLPLAQLQKRWEGNALVPLKKPETRFAEEGPVVLFMPATGEGKTFEPGEIGYVDCCFQNRGNAPLEVRAMRTSCECLEVIPDPVNIAPGKAASVQVKVDASKARLGTSGYAVFVATNDPLQELIQVPIHVKVQEGLICQPKRIEIGSAPRGAKEVAKVRLIWTKGTEFAVSSARSLDPRLHVSVSTPDRQPDGMREHDLTVSVTPDAIPGPVQATIAVLTDRPERPFVTIALTGGIAGDIATESDRVFLRVTSSEDTRRFRIWSRSGQDLAPTATCGSGHLAVTVTKDPDKTASWFLTVRPIVTSFAGVINDSVLVEAENGSDSIVLPICVEFDTKSRNEHDPTTPSSTDADSGRHLALRQTMVATATRCQ
jgi:hypothetical protein